MLRSLGRVFSLSIVMGAVWSAEARADIAPPFPEMPYIGGDVPNPIGFVIAGIAIAAATVALGWMIARAPTWRPGLIALAGLLAAAALVVFALASWSGKVHAKYRQERRRRPYDERLSLPVREPEQPADVDDSEEGPTP